MKHLIYFLSAVLSVSFSVQAKTVAHFEFSNARGYFVENLVKGDKLTIVYDEIAYDINSGGLGPKLTDGPLGRDSAILLNPGYDGHGPISVLTSNSRNYDFGTGDFVISGWFRSENVESANVSSSDRPEHRWIFNTARGSHQGISIYLIRDGVNPKGKLQVRVNGGDQLTKVISLQRLDDEQWHWFAAVAKDRKLSLYVDGVLQGTSDYNDETSATPSSDLFIGAQAYYASSNPFSGEIASIYAYNSTVEILQNPAGKLVGGQLFDLWKEPLSTNK